MSGFGGGVASLSMAGGSGMESIDMQLTAQSTGTTFGSYYFVNSFSQAVTTNWGYTGYFSFVVPNDDVYRIQARGASGGYSGVSSPSGQNYGAQIEADIAVTKGWIILFIVGQTGVATNDNEGSGGGGMSAVAYTTNTSNSTASVAAANPLVVGGGGGGACYNREGQDNARGYGNINSTYSQMLIGKAGLTSGYSTLGHGWPVGGGGLANHTGANNIAGWNGGGFNGGGSGNSARSGGSHGSGFREGAAGGLNQGGSYGGGGFGGGGGGAENCGYGGGAGGYSGGSSGGYTSGCGGHGGGGGSFYENSGSNSLVSATNTSNNMGYVRIRSSDQYP